MSELAAHLDGRKELLCNYGAELAGAPCTLRAMCMGIIPTYLKSDIMKTKMIGVGCLNLET